MTVCAICMWHKDTRALDVFETQIAPSFILDETSTIDPYTR